MKRYCLYHSEINLWQWPRAAAPAGSAATRGGSGLDSDQGADSQSQQQHQQQDDQPTQTEEPVAKRGGASVARWWFGFF